MHTGLSDEQIIVGLKLDYSSLQDSVILLEDSLRKAMDMLDREMTGKLQEYSYLFLCKEVRNSFDQLEEHNNTRFVKF